MSRFTFLFLACFICVTLGPAASDIATNEGLAPQIPNSVYSMYADCVLQGYLGPCLNLMFIDGKFDCKQVACAAPLRNNSTTHRAMDIGPALNGTHCGPHHVCIDEACIALPENAEMPEEIEKRERQLECHRADPNEIDDSENDFDNTE